MTLKLVFSERALQDIERNTVWWARNRSLTRAIELPDVVYRQLETMPGMPESYSLAPRNPQFDEVLREENIEMGVGGYCAVFTVRGNEVHVLTIRRGAQRELGDHEIG
jgi:plasmid stabilization system protein ParE